MPALFVLIADGNSIEFGPSAVSMHSTRVVVVEVVVVSVFAMHNADKRPHSLSHILVMLRSHANRRPRILTRIHAYFTHAYTLTHIHMLLNHRRSVIHTDVYPLTFTHSLIQSTEFTGTHSHTSTVTRTPAPSPANQHRHALHAVFTVGLHYVP